MPPHCIPGVLKNGINIPVEYLKDWEYVLPHEEEGKKRYYKEKVKQTQILSEDVIETLMKYLRRMIASDPEQQAKAAVLMGDLWFTG